MIGHKITQSARNDEKLNKYTYSDPGLGDSDLELLSWSASKMILLPVLRWLLELSEGNSGKLLDSNSGTYPKNEPPSSPKIKKGRKRPWEIRQKIQRGWKNTWKKLRNSHALSFGCSSGTYARFVCKIQEKMQIFCNSSKKGKKGEKKKIRIWVLFVRTNFFQFFVIR